MTYSRKLGETRDGLSTALTQRVMSPLLGGGRIGSQWCCWRSAGPAWVSRQVEARAFEGLFVAVVCVVVGLSL